MRASLDRTQRCAARALRVVAALGLAALAVPVAAACAKRGHPPANVILLSIDTLRFDSIRAYAPAAPPHPALDRLARASRVMLHAYSTASWTLPAHASLFTGLYPDRHGVTAAGQRLSKRARTLAALLRSSGWETVAFTDGGPMNRLFGLGWGFDRYDDWRRVEGLGGSSELPRGGRPDGVPGRSLFDRAIAFIESRSKGDPPFFLFVHTFAVHDYYLLPEWALDDLPDLPDHPDTYRDCVRGTSPCSREDWRTLESLYAIGIRHVDAGLGRLLETVERRGLRDDTWLFVLSDHGEGFDVEGGRIHHGGRLHEDLVRVPLLVSGPGAARGASEVPVSLADVMPTVLDLLGLAAPEHLDGASFAPVVLGASDPDRLATNRVLLAMEHVYYWRDGERRRERKLQRRPLAVAAIGPDWWYIAGREGEELYDRRADPRQHRNVAGERPGPARLRDGIALRDPHRVISNERPPDPELDEKLRSLGYIE